MLSVTRVREALSVFASLLGVIAIVSTLAVGVLGLLESAATGGVRGDLATRPGAELSLQLSQARAEDAAAQDAAVRSVIAAQFRSSGAPITLEVDRSLASSGLLTVTLPSRPDEPAQLVAGASLAALSDRATIVDGAWPARSDEASIQADAGALLGIAVGDRLTVGDAQLTITGSWRVDDAMDPRWGSDPLMATGAHGAISGPVVIDETAWPAVGDVPQVRWMIVPDSETIAAHDLDAVTAAWSGLPDALRSAGAADSPVFQEGGFIATTDELSVRMHALDAVTPVALLMIAAIALVTLLELGRLLTEIRGFELELLWARGATAGELARATAVEAIAVSVLGAGLGTAAVVGILSALGGGDAASSIGAAVWAVPLAAVAVAGAAFGVQTYRATRRGVRRDAPERSGRVRRVAGVGGVVLVTIAAAVSVWQLRLYGSPVTQLADGSSAVDPVTVVAPTLALVALVLLGLLVFPRIAPLAERSASRHPGGDRVLAARSVARRLPLVATPVVLVALAFGQFVVAGAYSATWQSSFTRTQELRAGASTRISTQFGGLAAPLRERIAAAPGVTALAPVYLGEVKTADSFAAVMGVAPRAFADLAETVDGTIDTAALAQAIDPGLPLPLLPGADLRLSIVSSAAQSPTVSVWVGDEFGQLRHVGLELDATGPTDQNGTAHYSAPMPPITGADNGWHLTAVDIAVTGSSADTSTPQVEIVAIEQLGQPVQLTAPWLCVGFVGNAPQRLNATASARGATLAAGVTLARLLPAGNDVGDPFDGAVPVAISSTLAERLQVEPGMTVTLPLVSGALPVETVIADVLVGIPGAPNAAALLVDAAVIDSLQLRQQVEPSSPTLLWIGSANPRFLGESLRQTLPGDVAVEVLERDQDRALLGSAATALWVAAAGSALLALAALGAVIGAQLRGRRGEVVVLRAIGMGSRQQGAVRRREFALVAAYGTVLGLVAGALAALATIATLARSAVPNPYAELPTALTFDPLWLGAAVLALLAAVAATVVVYGMAVAAHARTLGAQKVVR